MSWLIIVTLFLSPAYAIKFRIFSLPTDILMIWIIFVWIIFAVWLINKKLLSVFLTAIKHTDKKILTLVLIFLLSGIISLVVNGYNRAKLGQFIVLFLQPISIFIIGRFLIAQFPKTRSLLLSACYLLLAAAGLYAVIQYFTLLGLPPAWWGNSQEPKRALSFFIHPNFYALWCAPLFAFLIPDVFENLKSKILNLKSAAWLLGSFGLLLSLSRAGWLGLAAAILVYLLVAADARTRRLIFSGIVAAAIIVAAAPNIRWRIIYPFYAKETSTYSRLALWQSGVKGIEQSPIWGLGLNGYAEEYPRLMTNKALDAHNFPHNIFLDFWVETGLLGLISFVILVGLYIYRGLKSFVIPSTARNPLDNQTATDKASLTVIRGDIIKLSIALFLITLLVQGFIDNPYFKNDLALVFWIILSYI